MGLFFFIWGREWIISGKVLRGGFGLSSHGFGLALEGSAKTTEALSPDIKTPDVKVVV